MLRLSRSLSRLETQDIMTQPLFNQKIDKFIKSCPFLTKVPFLLIRFSLLGPHQKLDHVLKSWFSGNIPSKCRPWNRPIFGVQPACRLGSQQKSSVYSLSEFSKFFFNFWWVHVFMRPFLQHLFNFWFYRSRFCCR